MPNTSLDKNRFDALMALANYRLKRSFNRTQYEWRMSFAVWAILVAGTFYLRPRPPEIILVGILIITVVVHFWYSSEVRKRNRLDTETAFYYIDHAEQLLGLINEPPRIRPNFDKAMKYSFQNAVGVFTQDSWWNGIQFAITAGLALCSYWLTGTLVRPN